MHNADQMARGEVAGRRYDVDQLRVFALLCLILYHVALVFRTYPWRIQSSHAGLFGDVLVDLIQPWRMLVVFFVGGIAVRLAVERNTLRSFVKARVVRLLIPFIFTVIVWVPPQGYAVYGSHRYSVAGYLDYLANEAPFAVNYHGVPLPEFAHAWFLPYLFAYSVCAALLWFWRSDLIMALQNSVAKRGFAVVVAAVMLLMAIVLSLVRPYRPETGLLLNDISSHVHYVPIFALGFVCAKQETFWAAVRVAWKALLGLAAALAAIVLVIILSHGAPVHAHTAEGLALHALEGVYGGAMLFGLVGVFSARFGVASAALAYANEAILPVYLMHQTVIVVAGQEVLTLGWSLAEEYFVLVVLSIALPLLIHHLLVRNCQTLRFLFGLAPGANRPSPVPVRPLG